jgi:hypothetical protein
MHDKKPVYLFIVCPNNSGSTLLAKLLATSVNVSTFPTYNHEGQWVVRDSGTAAMPFPIGDEKRNWTIAPDKFSDTRCYCWETLKEVWHRAWDMDKPVLLEKSPSLVISASLFQEQFKDAYFILSVRNPYAFCEGVRRREGYRLEVAAKHWQICCDYQLQNRNVLKKQCFLRYEELCNNPAGMADRLGRFLPYLADIDPGRVFEVMSLKTVIANQNEAQIGRLSLDDIREINAVLDRRPLLLDTFCYDRIS